MKERERLALIAQFPEPDGTPLSNLKHYVDIFEGSPDSEKVLIATSGIYGDGVRTGLTHGDLRALLHMAEQLQAVKSALEEPQEIVPPGPSAHERDGRWYVSCGQHPKFAEIVTSGAVAAQMIRHHEADCSHFCPE
jgi:hypothetical protein